MRVFCCREEARHHPTAQHSHLPHYIFAVDISLGIITLWFVFTRVKFYTEAKVRQKGRYNKLYFNSYQVRSHSWQFIRWYELEKAFVMRCPYVWAVLYGLEIRDFANRGTDAGESENCCTGSFALKWNSQFQHASLIFMQSGTRNTDVVSSVGLSVKRCSSHGVLTSGLFYMV